MDVYSVTAVVDGFDLDSEFQNAGIECLSYELVVSRTAGVTRVDAEIPALAPLDAVLQLMSDLRSINVTVVRLDPDLVSVPEIAERCAISREAARLWATGKRRAGFPAPYATVGTTSLWFWADVCEWLATAGLEIEDRPVPSSIVEAINGALAHIRHARRDGWLQPTSAPVAHIAQRQVRHSTGWRKVDAIPA